MTEQLCRLLARQDCVDDDRWQDYRTQAAEIMALQRKQAIELSATAYQLVGFSESLAAGDTVTGDYLRRMREYYIPNLLNAVAAITGEQP